MDRRGAPAGPRSSALGPRRNAPHGGYLPVSLAYAAVVVPREALGSIGALKAVTIVGAAAGFLAWVATAARLAGPGAAWILAALLLLPPPALLGGQLVAWGSHAEAPWLLGILAWLAARTEGSAGRREAIAVGLAAGVCAGFDLLAAPLAVAVVIGWSLDRGRRQGIVALGVASAVAGAALWITGGLGASVTETAGNAPLALLERAGVVAGSLASLLPLPFSGSSAVGVGATGVNGALTVGLVAFAVVAAATPGATRWRARLWLVAAPLGFLLLLAAMAPRRPEIAVRYLLPVWPLLLLGLALGAARAWRSTGARGAAATMLGAMLFLGITAAAPLLTPSRSAGFLRWDPARYTAADLGHVTYELAPGLETLLDRVGPRIVLPGPGAPDVRGLGAVLGAGSADCLLLDGPHRFAPEHVAVRIAATAPRLLDTDRDRFYQQVGWGLTLVYAGQTAARLGIVSRLDPTDLAAVQRGERDAAGWLR